MMNAFQLIRNIKQAGGNVCYDHDQLIVEAPDDFMTNDIVDYLSAGKPLLLTILNIEHYLKLFREMHSKDQCIDVELFLKEIVKNSANLDNVLNWLRFFVDIDVKLEEIKYKDPNNLPVCTVTTEAEISKRFEQEVFINKTGSNHDSAIA